MYLRLFIGLFILQFGLSAQAQSTSPSIELINERRSLYAFRGGASLTTWAGLNIVGGSIGALNSTGSTKAFWEMNIYWNIVNLGLGIPALLQARKQLRAKESLSLKESLKAQRKYEQAYLFNTALDVSYISSGLFLRLLSARAPNVAQQELERGYGNSLILQGSYLFVYDLIALIAHQRNGKGLYNKISKVAIVPTGNGVGLYVSLN